MGETGTAAGTYVGMIHANTVAIVTALGGKPVVLPAALLAWAERWDVAVGE
jgi:manganese/zinc/iron transport system substrate-binding protein